MKTIKRILSQTSISKSQQKFLLILFPMYPDHPLNDSDDLPVLFGLLLYVLTQCRPHRTQLRLRGLLVVFFTTLSRSWVVIFCTSVRSRYSSWAICLFDKFSPIK